MTIVTVLGGWGFLGSRAAAALERVPGLTVQRGSRRGPVVVDLTKPDTFAALATSDVVVDLTNGTAVGPDDVAAWCVKNGKLFLECTSDAAAIERLHVKLRLESTASGLAILGGGIFTGVSNLMARSASDELGGADSVQWATSTSPYSGAGQGTVDLMVSSLGMRATRYESGQRVDVSLRSQPFWRGCSPCCQPAC